MASIVKRKKKYSVVYTYIDESGKKRQKWETFDTSTEAKKRKNQIEYEQETGSFIVPTAKTVNDLLEEYMSIYGVNTWAMSTYESRQSLLSNYVRPIIGDMKLEDLNPRVMDKYYFGSVCVDPPDCYFSNWRFIDSLFIDRIITSDANFRETAFSVYV